MVHRSTTRPYPLDPARHPDTLRKMLGGGRISSAERAALEWALGLAGENQSLRRQAEKLDHDARTLRELLGVTLRGD